MATRLLIIRHGESDGNKLDLYTGHSDVEITELGKKQAQKTADFLKARESVDKVYASDLSRAIITAEIIAKAQGREVIADAGLRELYGGEWEMKSFNGVIPTEYPEDYAVWKNAFSKSRPTGGESVEELSERIVKSVLRIAEENDGKTVVIVTHGTPIRIIACLTSGNPLEKIQDMEWVANASITELTVDNGVAVLGTVGYDNHLEGMLTKLSKQI